LYPRSTIGAVLTLYRRHTRDCFFFNKSRHTKGARACKAACTIWSVDPELAIRTATTLDAVFDRLTAVRQFNMLLISLFGLVGGAVAAAGIYGIVACDVAERTHEIAVRMALGAGRTRVVADVLIAVATYVDLGLTTGLVGAAALATLIKAFLFEVHPHDVEVYALVALTLATASLLAAWFPARRAATIDPLISMRS
jgi:putative ABC transport system permease protein